MHRRTLTARRAALSGASIAAAAVLLAPGGAHAAPAAPSRTSTGAAATSTPPHRPATVSALTVPSTPSATRRLAGSADRSDAATALVADLPARRTAGFGMVGVTWDQTTGTGTVTAQVRTLSKGRWSGWSTLDVDEDGAESTRAGTEPMWVGSADGVATRVTSSGGVAPRGVKVDLVDPGTDPAGSSTARSSDVARASAAVSDGSPSYTAEPTIISRAAWGARPNTPCDSPRIASRTWGVIFHHTADSNSYTEAASKSIVRATQAYHMQSRGWCDIGYNFLVDKYGQIFEGRSGGVLSQVRGAHAGNTEVNTYDMGVSMIGNLDTARPTAAMEAAAVKLIGWRLGTNYLPAIGTYTVQGHRLNRIAGHRDVYLSGIRPATATVCPGRYGYAWLVGAGGLRDRVAAYIKSYRTPISVRAAQLGHAVTGWVRAGEYVTEGGHKTIFGNGDMYAKGSLGAHFVSGTVHTEYAVWGIQHGALGFPTSDLTGGRVAPNAYQHFEHGSIYRVPYGKTTTAYGLTSGVDNAYLGLGGFHSRLGLPTSRVTTSGNVDRARFTHGSISYDRTTHKVVVTYS